MMAEWSGSTAASSGEDHGRSEATRQRPRAVREIKKGDDPDTQESMVS